MSDKYVKKYNMSEEDAKLTVKYNNYIDHYVKKYNKIISKYSGNKKDVFKNFGCGFIKK